MKTNRSDHDEFRDSTSSTARRRVSTRKASHFRSISRSSREASSSRQRSQYTSLTELIEHFWNWFLWVFGLITGTLHHVLFSTSSRIFMYGVMLCAVTICAPLIMETAAVVPRFAVDQLCDNALLHLATSKTASLLSLPKPCLMEPEARKEGLPDDITDVRVIARWGNTASELLEARDSFFSLSRDLST